MILLGVAPCTAMVFVWSQLVKGDANYTLGAGVGERLDHGLRGLRRMAAFLLGVTDIVTVPWETLLLSTVLYRGAAAAGGHGHPARLLVQRSAAGRWRAFTARLKPWSGGRA